MQSLADEIGTCDSPCHCRSGLPMVKDCWATRRSPLNARAALLTATLVLGLAGCASPTADAPHLPRPRLHHRRPRPRPPRFRRRRRPLRRSRSHHPARPRRPGRAPTSRSPILTPTGRPTARPTWCCSSTPSGAPLARWHATTSRRILRPRCLWCVQPAWPPRMCKPKNSRPTANPDPPTNFPWTTRCRGEARSCLASCRGRQHRPSPHGR